RSQAFRATRPGKTATSTTSGKTIADLGAGRNTGRAAVASTRSHAEARLRSASQAVGTSTRHRAARSGSMQAGPLAGPGRCPTDHRARPEPPELTIIPRIAGGRSGGPVGSRQSVVGSEEQADVHCLLPTIDGLLLREELPHGDPEVAQQVGDRQLLIRA